MRKREQPKIDKALNTIVLDIDTYKNVEPLLDKYEINNISNTDGTVTFTMQKISPTIIREKNTIISHTVFVLGLSAVALASSFFIWIDLMF